MSKDIKTFEDRKPRLELYNELKELYRFAISIEDSATCEELENAIEQYSDFTVDEFLNDMKREDKAKERAANSAVDADKFFKDHFVFATVKM